MTISSSAWRTALRWCGYVLVLLVLVVAAALAFFRWEASVRESQTASQLAPSTGRFIRAADVTLFVQEQGRRDALPVVFVHGTGAWSESWRDTLNAVAAAGFRAVALDLPPFGFSERPVNKDYSNPSQARRILGAMDALQIDTAVLVGHSFGGGPTMEAAFLIPARMHALVLVDVALGLDDTSADSHGATQTFLAMAPLRNALVATFLTNPRFTKRLLQQFIADPARATDQRVAIYQRPLSIGGTTSAVGEWLPVLMLPQPRSPATDPDSYRRFPAPTRIIWGAEDTITPIAQAEHLAKLLPSAELFAMKGVGHIPQIENPAEFNGLLIDFLSSRDPNAKGVSDERN